MNCVVMDLKDAELHWLEYKEGGKLPGDVWGNEVERLIAQRREEVRQWQKWVL